MTTTTATTEFVCPNGTVGCTFDTRCDACGTHRCSTWASIHQLETDDEGNLVRVNTYCFECNPAFPPDLSAYLKELTESYKAKNG